MNSFRSISIYENTFGGAFQPVQDVSSANAQGEGLFVLTNKICLNQGEYP